MAILMKSLDSGYGRLFGAYQVSGALKDVSQQSDYLLFDAPVAGSGQTFDWQALTRIKLTALYRRWFEFRNVREAIQHLAPYAVDV